MCYIVFWSIYVNRICSILERMFCTTDRPCSSKKQNCKKKKRYDHILLSVYDEHRANSIIVAVVTKVRFWKGQK